MVTYTEISTMAQKGTAGYRVTTIRVQGEAGDTYGTGIPLGAQLRTFWGYKTVAGRTLLRVIPDTLVFDFNSEQLTPQCALARVDHSDVTNPILNLYDITATSSPDECNEIGDVDIADLDMDIVIYT
jgi:hypothetical protein|tara:strand:+ start:1677 stop:2057 length:381 start_codon:yes stop_codon:yes gene_type:complete